MSRAYKAYLADEFRKRPTAAEEKLWKFLKAKRLLKLKFRRQYRVGGYIIDFYCPQLKIGIEVDGKIHKSHKIQDSIREQVLKNYRISLVRITNEEIETDPIQVFKKIELHIKTLLQNYFL